MGSSSPRVLAILPGFIPSTLISIVKPFLHLHQGGHIIAKITLDRFVSKKNLQWADLVVFCRNTEPRHVHLMHYLLTQNTPFIYDLDDNFFELSLDSELGKYHRSPERLSMLIDYIKFANLVRVYSKPLLEKSKTFNLNVEQCIGSIDLGLISSPHQNLNPKRIKLVYGTSRIQDKLSVLFTFPLTRILKEYSGRVEFHFWGSLPTELKGHPGVVYHRVIRNYDRFLKRFSQAGFDIGLAPLPNDLFHRSKTNNKFREYGACRIAGIYSDVDIYSNCVINGETGLIVPNEPEAWYQAMVRLIEDFDLREKIKGQAQEYVRQRYSQEIFEKVWRDQIQKVLSRRNQPEDSLPSIASMPQMKSPSGRNSLKKINRLVKNGFAINMKILRWRLFDLWMIIKLRLRN